MAGREISVKKYVVKLSAEEREQLEAMICAGKHPAQSLTKARILLKADVSEAGEGWSDSAISAALDTSINNIGRTRRRLVEEGIAAALADHADVTLQVETLQNFLTQKPDAIVLAAIDLNAVAPVLKQARKQGIVVTTFDADAAADARDMFFNQMSYKQAAKTMLDCALMDAPEGGEVAFVAASPTSPNHSAHIKYMKEYIQNDPKYLVFKVVDTQYANDEDAKSYDVAINLMQAHPNLKVIISSSAVSAPAGARAIDASGHAGKVFSTGFALPSAIKTYLEDGSEKCFALWNPYELGYLATYATHLKLAGKLDLKPGTTFKAGKAGEYTVGEGGEIVYGKPLMFTKDTVDKAGF